MIRNLVLFTVMLLLTISCSSDSEQESDQVSTIQIPQTIDKITPDLNMRDLKVAKDQMSNRLIELGWNKPTNSSATYSIASDLKAIDIKVVKDGISKAEEYLGNYGPLKVFIIGTDVEAANVLAKEFCEWAYDRDRFDYCFNEDQGNEIREIAKHEGNNGFAQHSRGREIPNQSFVVGNPHKYSEEGYKIAIHEYVHIYQNAHIYEEGMPIWLEEGSAEYLAQQLSGNYESFLRQSIKDTKRLRREHSDIQIKDIATSELREKIQEKCDDYCTWVLQYKTGAIATAFLISQTSLDYFYKTYIPSIFYLGEGKAFESSFGVTFDEFYVIFEEFLNKSDEEQENILNSNPNSGPPTGPPASGPPASGPPSGPPSFRSLPELGVKVEYSDQVKLWGENCTNDPFYGTVEIPIIDYFNNLEAKTWDVFRNETYSFREGDKVARNGPFTTWYFEMFLQDISSNVPEKFESISYGSHPEYFWEDYFNYVVTVCETFHGRDTLRNAVLAHSKLMNWNTRWPGHASKWEPFPYIETGREVFKAPSPSGLEHYTKYITASGVIIVGGEKVPARAMLAAYDRVNYMLSARPEFHDILKENNVRISLFGPGSESTTSELPEFEGLDEPGGFSMGVTDAAMTANVEWLCYPGNPDRGGDPVMHELVHTLNGIVFEQINELYFYERIYDLALSAIDKGIFATNYTQHLDDGEQQGMKHYVGEYWAMTVEGYLMDMEGFKYSHDTHEWIKENDPELYDLIIRYFPTQKWDQCTGELKN